MSSFKIIIGILILIISFQFIIYGIRSHQNVYSNNKITITMSGIGIGLLVVSVLF